jgi:hypothetical protein
VISHQMRQSRDDDSYSPYDASADCSQHFLVCNGDSLDEAVLPGAVLLASMIHGAREVCY